nr:secreted protein [Thraustotheca clavata]
MSILFPILFIILVVLGLDDQPMAIKNQVQENVPRPEVVHTEKINDKPKFNAKQRRAVGFLQSALNHFENQKWPLVVEECEKAIAADPEMVFGHALMGNALNVMMQWEQAADSWRKATELDPTSFEFYYHLGFALSQMAQDQVNNQKKHAIGKEAIESFETYLKLVDNEPEATQEQMSLAHASLAAMYKLNKMAEKQELALSHFEAAAALDSNNELAFFNLGLMYAEKYEKRGIDSDLELAIHSLEKAVQLNPTNTKYKAVLDALVGHSSPAELMAAMQQL